MLDGVCRALDVRYQHLIRIFGDVALVVVFHDAVRGYRQLVVFQFRTVGMVITHNRTHGTASQRCVGTHGQVGWAIPIVAILVKEVIQHVFYFAVAL